MQSSHSALKSPMKQSGFTCGHPSMPSMRAAEFERKKVMLMMNPIWDDTYMTSALRGEEGGYPQKQTK